MTETKSRPRKARIALLVLGLGLLALLCFLLWRHFRVEPRVGVETYFETDMLVAVLSPPEAVAPDEARAVAQAIETHGDAATGGRIRRISLGDGGCGDLGSCLAIAASDPKVGAIVVLAAGQGTAKAFRDIRKARPRLLLFASRPSEDPGAIARDATLAVGGDNVAMGFAVANAARGLGAKGIVRLCARGHPRLPQLRFLAVMEKAAADGGLEVGQVVVPDEVLSRPAWGDPYDTAAPGDGSKAAAWLEASFAGLLQRHGPFTAFFACHEELKAPLIKAVSAQGGFYLEGFDPSPYVGYPEAFGLDPSRLGGPRAPLGELEAAAVKGGFSGRVATWPSSLGGGLARGLIELSVGLLSGTLAVSDFEGVLGSGAKGSGWHVGGYQDPLTGREVPRFVMATQGLDILGMGAIALPGARVPGKYYDIPQPRDPSDFRIGVLASDTGQSVDDLLGAREMQRIYGDANESGMVRVEVVGRDFADNPAATQRLIEGLMDDPLTKVIVINEGVPGTLAGLRAVMAQRPDIFTIVSEAHEDLAQVAQASDLVIMTDFVARGYLIPRGAKELGAKAFVHISFPRHLSVPQVGRMRGLMEMACSDLGLSFHAVEGLDPTGPGGIDAARKDIEGRYPGWLEEYGPDTAFYSTNDAHAQALIGSVLRHGGYFPEADMPSPIMGFPEALGVPLPEGPEMGKPDYWTRYVGLLEDKADKAGAAGRLGTWVYPSGLIRSFGAIEYGRGLLLGLTTPRDAGSLLRAMGDFSPGPAWKGSFFVDPHTGKPSRSIILVYQDTYVLGRGYLGNTKLRVPGKYLLQGFSYSG
ncbi:MAG: DUF3798 domain-containing protein, partial [Deltaproteobacteria bacterium]|nr:DUF3798 domain-containing protein [Deltaproteobacteria bacterium]